VQLKKRLLDLQIQLIENKYADDKTDKPYEIKIGDFNKNKITNRILEVSQKLEEADKLQGDSSYKLNDLDTRYLKIADDLSAEENKLNYQSSQNKNNDQI